MQYPKASCSILLYRVSVLVRLLLVNAIGQSVVFSGASIHGTHIPSLTCRGFATNLSLGTVVLSYYRKSLPLPKNTV